MWQRLAEDVWAAVVPRRAVSVGGVSGCRARFRVQEVCQIRAHSVVLGFFRPAVRFELRVSWSDGSLVSFGLLGAGGSLA